MVRRKASVSWQLSGVWSCPTNFARSSPFDSSCQWSIPATEHASHHLIPSLNVLHRCCYLVYFLPQPALRHSVRCAMAFTHSNRRSADIDSLACSQHRHSTVQPRVQYQKWLVGSMAARGIAKPRKAAKKRPSFLLATKKISHYVELSFVCNSLLVIQSH